MRSILSKLFSKSETIKSTLGSGFLDQETARPLKPWEVDNYIIQTLARIETTLANLAAIVSAAEQADRERDEKAMANAQQTLELARQAKTVSESSNIAVKEALRLLKENQKDPADTAALDEVKTILEGMIADDSAVLTEGTAAEDETT